MNMFGSFLPSLGRQATTVYSGRGSRHCYEIKTQVPTTNLGHPPSLYTFSSNPVAILPPRSSWPQSWTCQARATRPKRIEISPYAGRRIRRSECGRKSRLAPFEMTGGGGRAPSMNKMELAYIRRLGAILASCETEL